MVLRRKKYRHKNKISGGTNCGIRRMLPMQLDNEKAQLLLEGAWDKFCSIHQMLQAGQVAQRGLIVQP